MKKVICFLTAGMIMCAGMPSALSQNPVTVVVNGEKLNADQGAEIYDGRTFLPLRAVSETVGAAVEWYESEHAAMVSKGNVSLLIYIGDEQFYAKTGNGNWEEIALDAPARIVNDRTMVPIRAIAEQLGLDVGWDSASYTVTIGAGGKTFVAEPLGNENIQYTAIDKSSNKMQSFDAYCGGRLSTNGGIKNFRGTGEDKEVVDDYVDLLCSGNMNFKLVDAYESSYNKSSFFSYAIDYTGTAKVSGNIEMLFKDDVICDLCIYGIIERDNLDLRLIVPDSIEIMDLGYRYGGAREDINPAGASAMAGLYSLGGGSFE
ncbi:MAG: copper amine oxidase N-terminal domain-containing protein, partial [Candidatus Ornithomonoglobus sp.]